MWQPQGTVPSGSLAHDTIKEGKNVNLTTKFLHALFEPLVQNDAEAVVSILSAAAILEAEPRDALRRYVDDPLGVRKWNLNERVFFVGDDFPVVAKRAMLRLREARVAAAYGLRAEAFEVLEQTLQMPPERLRQVARALEVYEMGIMRAHESVGPESVAAPSSQEPEEVAPTPVLEEPVAAAARKPAKPAKPAGAAAATAKKPSKVKPRPKGKSVSSAP